jgi:hypothetical protein
MRCYVIDSTAKTVVSTKLVGGLAGIGVVVGTSGDKDLAAPKAELEAVRQRVKFL